jgi:REP element-mobilizing transposase RayT
MAMVRDRVHGPKRTKRGQIYFPEATPIISPGQDGLGRRWMPRIGRVVLPNYPHHIVQRGHNRRVVFAETADFEYYLAALVEFKIVYDVRVYGFCLMTNHVHLILGPGEAVTGLGQLMKQRSGGSVLACEHISITAPRQLTRLTRHGRSAGRLNRPPPPWRPSRRRPWGGMTGSCPPMPPESTAILKIARHFSVHPATAGRIIRRPMPKGES